MNVPKQDGDIFIVRKKYAFTFSKPKVRTIIIADVYPGNICVICFHTDGAGSDKNKYKLRFNYSGVHVLHIFLACLHVFNVVKEDNHYALFYNASNDLGDYQEDNKRYSAYGTFFERYLQDYENYKVLGSLKLNIQGFYHSNHPHMEQVTAFYEHFMEEVMRDLNAEDSEK
jgi:hypothetical protein